MKRIRRCFSKGVLAMSAVSLAMAMGPVLQAQQQLPQSPAPASSTSQASTQTADRLAQLEKEVSQLQSEIESLKSSEEGTPSMKTAAYVEPMQQAGAATAPAPAAAPAPTPVTFVSLLGPTTITGFVDGYYGFNFNQPTDLGNHGGIPTGISGNGLQFFTNNTNQFSLNAAELVVDKAPDATAGGTGRAGYHIGIIYGQAAQVVNGPNNSTDASNLALKEAYIDYIAPIGKGLTLTFGKFVTPAGAEVIESNANWNYTRSILFYYAIPFFHFGLNAKYTFNPKWSITGYLVNGWNNSQEVNTGKTYGVSIAWTPNKYWAITENYMAGPEDNAFFNGYVGKPNDNWRQLEDATIGLTPNAKWALQLNGDYGYGDKYGDGVDVAANSSAVDWWGLAPYVKYTFNGKSNFAMRYEYYSDPQGFTLFGPGNLNGHVQEFTNTYSYNLTSELTTRFEFREDWSNRDIFEKGARFVGSQPTATIGITYSFSSANAK
jgi:TolA-binding protein